MSNCSFYTKDEIALHNLNIPTDDEVDDLLKTLDNNQPMCATASQNTVTPSAFCACSRQATGAITTFCDLCQ
jgi:hypothetical protein